MDCRTFVEGFSEYRDELLPLPERLDFEAHLRACGSCSRYERVVRAGVEVLASGPEVRVSDRFMERLQHRLHHVDDEMARERWRRASPRRSLFARSAAVAAAAGAIALAPSLLSRGPATVTRLPAVVAAAPGHDERAVPRPGPGAGVEGLTARLEEVGVRVLPLPYREVVHHSAARVTLAAYAHGE
jgi:hypothetical protein